MRSSWLVQRLEKPWGGLGQLTDNPFNFGGGMKNGGLSDEAMGLIRGIFSFDYMGAAEFEYGAVPKALQAVAAADSLTAYEFSIPFADVEESWRKTDVHPTGEARVFVLAPGEMGDEVRDRIEEWAAGKGRLKESTRLPQILRGDEHCGEICGWLELDNGFFFFTDRAMWAATARLFGVDVDEAVAS